jgi:hypothetical protein
MKKKLHEEEKDDDLGQDTDKSGDEDSLLSDLENLDDADNAGSDSDQGEDTTGEDDSVSVDDGESSEDESGSGDSEPEDNIVDMFTKGDMDGVKAHIQAKVVSAVSDIVNAPPEEDSGEETSD